MRQRNVTIYELFSPGVGEHPAIVIAPGEIVDYPIPLTGCEVVEDEPPVKSKPKTAASEEPTP